jgi:hypothetical protein
VSVGLALSLPTWIARLSLPVAPEGATTGPALLLPLVLAVVRGEDADHRCQTQHADDARGHDQRAPPPLRGLLLLTL